MKTISRDAIQRMFDGTGSLVGGGGGGSMSIAGMATQMWTENNYLSKQFFSNLFTIHTKITTSVEDSQGDPVGDPTVTSGVLAPNAIPGEVSTIDEQTGYTTTVKTEIDNIEAKKGFWTEEFLSALGLNSSGGGGGGGAESLTELSDVYPYMVPSDGDALIYSASLGKWTSGTLSGYARLQSPNNLTCLNNEFISAAPGQTGAYYWNFRTASGNYDGGITQYNFCDGAGNVLAYISSGQFSGNAASATKLGTARTLWGQPFDGSANVSGNMTGVGEITMVGGLAMWESSNRVHDFNIFWANDIVNMYAYENRTWDICIGTYYTSVADGALYFNSQQTSWGIGTSSPYTKLDINGGIKASKYYLYKPYQANDTDAVYLTYDTANSVVNIVGGSLGGYLPLTGGTMSNTNVVTNMNADLLDGYHAASFARQQTDNDLVFLSNEVTVVPSGFSGELYLNYRTAGRNVNGSITKYNFCDGGGHVLAYISSGQFSGNAATASSATKLGTARTLWGQSFDGSANVSGNMSSVGEITMTGAITMWESSNLAHNFNIFWANDIVNIYSYKYQFWDISIGTYYANVTGNGGLYFDASAKSWGINTSTPSYTLDVNGAARVTELWIGSIHITYDSTNGGLLIANGGLAASTYVSALGVNSSGGSGVTLLEPLNSINQAGLASHPSSSGQTIVWNGSAWVYGTTAGVDMSTVWTNLAANGSEQINASHLSTALSSYVLSSAIKTLTLKGDGTTVTTFTPNSANATFNIEGGTGISLTRSTNKVTLALSTIANAAGSYKVVTVDNYGRVTSGTNPSTLSGFGLTDAVPISTTWWGRSISSGVVTGDMSYVGNISFAASGKNIGGLLYFDTSTNRLGVGISSPTYLLHVAGSTYTTKLYLASGVYFEYDGNGGVKLNGAGFYTDSFVSALGLNSGGGGTTLNEPLSSINASSMAAPTATGSTIVWNGSTWVYSSGNTLRAGNLSSTGTVTAYSDIISQYGNLQITNGRGAINGSIDTDYMFWVNGRTKLYGKVGVNQDIPTITSSNAHIDLFVSNYIQAYGLIQTSDMNKKTVTTNIDNLTVNDIALAPVFNFRWKDSTDMNEYVGTSAQYWQKALPNTVKCTDGIYLSMDYSAAAITAAVITARKVADHERRIAQLEAENAALRQELVNLRAS